MSTTCSIYGNLSVRSRYVCRCCGAQQVGDSVTVELDVGHPQEVAQQLARVRPTPHAMPDGWASYGGTFACPVCKQ